MVCVAPSRQVLARHSRARAPSGARVAQMHLGMAALGLPTPRTDASGVTVAIVDTGVDQGHPDLAGAIDAYVNFTNDSDKDLDVHATHGCGIVAATGSAPQGMLGVCNARLLVFKGLGTRDSARAYHRALRAACTQAKIVNLSLGGPCPDPGEQVIIEKAIRGGTLVVAAMGNELKSGSTANYPAALPGVLAVGAVDPRFARADFSNTGAHSDLVAPGVAIWSTAPTHSPLECFYRQIGPSGSTCDRPSITATRKRRRCVPGAVIHGRSPAAQCLPTRHRSTVDRPGELEPLARGTASTTPRLHVARSFSSSSISFFSPVGGSAPAFTLMARDPRRSRITEPTTRPSTLNSREP